jgi:hypothetical protein
VNLKEVQDILHADIFEKKLRMAKGDNFDEIKGKARIDNFLAGTSQAPDRAKVDAKAGTPRVDEAVRQTSGPPPR